MAVITISRELGSEGTYISRRAAEDLGFRFVDKYTIEHVLKEYGLIQFFDVYESTPGFWARLDTMSIELIKMLNQVVLALASRGDTVILGRGGFAVLGGYADALNVRIQAPFLTRAGRLLKRENLPDLHKAEELIKENDRARSAFIETFYHTRWDLTSAFNLVIDTGSVPPDLATKWIVEASQALEKRRFKENDRTTRMIQVDPVLAKAVEDI